MKISRIKGFVEDTIQGMAALNDKNWDFMARGFTAIDKSLHYIRNPFLKPLFKKAMKLENPKTQLTQGVVVPIRKDLSFHNQAQNVVLPVDLVRKAINESSYRVIMDKCICRTAQKCTRHPIDLGCIFLGKGAKVLVQNRVAREATRQEALHHLDLAAAKGLICQCLWVEAERFFLGLKKEEHKKFLEICLCCPCCCLGFRNFIHMPPELMERFRPMSWKAQSTDACTLCMACERACPVGAISMGGGKVSVAENCIGCGICASQCRQKAMEMKQVRAVKENVMDYLSGLSLEL